MITDKAFATLPVTLMIIGTALTTGPAALLIHSWGRKRGFMFGASLTIPSALVAGYAAFADNFILFCLAHFVLGASAAFAQQYRFAAADSVPADLKGRAISWVMFGGVAAGFIGPQLVTLSRLLVGGESLAASYFVMVALAIVTVAVLSQTRLAPTVRPVRGPRRRASAVGPAAHARHPRAHAQRFGQLRADGAGHGRGAAVDGLCLRP